MMNEAPVQLKIGGYDYCFKPNGMTVADDALRRQLHFALMEFIKTHPDAEVREWAEDWTISFNYAALVGTLISTTSGFPVSGDIRRLMTDLPAYLESYRQWRVMPMRLAGRLMETVLSLNNPITPEETVNPTDGHS